MDDRISIIKGDITALEVDAIVNAANSSLMGGGGVDGAIHRAAGPELAAYCRTLKGCVTGDAKISPGFNLPAKHVIHTVGPVWNNGTAGEEELLRLAYHRSLEVAVSNEIRSIAFPSISTGAYRFPFELATVIARDTISAFLKNTDQPAVVIMVAFAEKDYQRMLKIYNESSDNSG
ncbi:MAG: O-acetyl-ADP-ribose deacetylase [Bacteroidota bacterium]